MSPRVMMVLRAERGGEYRHVKRLCAELPAHGYELAVCGPHGEQEDELGVPVYNVDIKRPIDPVGDLRAAAGVAAAIRDFKPDLVHAHGSKGGTLARIARLAHPRTPVVYTPHQFGFVNYFPSERQRKAYRAIERALLPLTSRFLAVCEDEADAAASIGGGRRARVVHNGIEPLELDGREVPPEAARMASGGPLIVAVAELHIRKGVISLIDAMPEVLKSHPTASLAIAGEGTERDALEARIFDLGLTDSVVLLGEVHGVEGLLSAADLYVNPAWAEAFPYAVIEAMSVGLPIVATDVGGTREAIENMVTGRLIDPGSPEQLAEAISGCLSDAELARKLGAQARDRMMSEFTLTTMIAGTVAVYRELGV